MEQFISFFSLPVVSTIVSILRVIFILFSIILFFAIIFLLIKTSWLRFRYYEDYTEFFASRPFGKKEKFKKLESINKKLAGNKESDYKMAVIEAEDFLKEVLSKMGYKGDSLDEVLNQIDNKILPSIEKVKDVQKIRDSIIHNPDYDLTKDQAANIVKVYEQALNELEAL